MDLRGHELRAAEVPAYAALLRDHYSHEKFDETLVLEHFPQWISSDLLKGWVAEDGGRLLCFGASVFVSDHFADRLSVSAEPCAGARILQTFNATEPHAHGDGEVERAPLQSGVNVLIVHSGLPPSGSDEETVARVKAIMMQGFLSLHSGYQIQRILVEAFGEDERTFYLQSGFAAYSTPPFGVAGSHWSENILPYLLTLKRETVITLDIHPLLPLFTCPHPKCGLTAGEQVMLRDALEGHTDDELANLLGLSLSTVKKRWIGIFERVDRSIPGVTLNEHRSDQKRGPQKRHTLLRYLRNHPEELAPRAALMWSDSADFYSRRNATKA